MTNKTAVDATAEEIPMLEAGEEIADYLPPKEDLTLRDPTDDHEAAVVLAAHDEKAILERIQQQALKKWVYRLPTGETGLSVDGVQDVIQIMNWQGGCRIGVMHETLDVEQVVADDEEMWVATIFAKDHMTGQEWPGSSSQPVRMKLRADTARKWRGKGKKVRDDDTVFDVFSRTKAIQKACRNACAAFIPEQIEQTILALYTGQADRVERIRTEAEAKVEELPPPLTDERAEALREQARAIYSKIRELPRGTLDLTPGLFHSYMTRAEHSHERLEEFVAYLQQRHDEIAAKAAG